MADQNNSMLARLAGLGLAIGKTRRPAAVGTLGYLAYVAGNAVGNR